MWSLETRIKKHEGLILRYYRDSLGIPTIGYGHNLTKGLPKELLEVLFQLDLKEAYEDFIFRLPDKYKQHLNNAQKGVIIELIFNMGLSSLLSFKKMLSALQNGDFETAGAELLNSRYHKQVGSRCETLANILKTGKDPDLGGMYD